MMLSVCAECVDLQYDLHGSACGMPCCVVRRIATLRSAGQRGVSQAEFVWCGASLFGAVDDIVLS